MPHRWGPYRGCLPGYRIQGVRAAMRFHQFCQERVGRMAGPKCVPSGYRTVGAPWFKDICQKLPKEVVGTGAGVVLTKNGHPTAKLVA